MARERDLTTDMAPGPVRLGRSRPSYQRESPWRPPRQLQPDVAGKVKLAAPSSRSTR